MKNDAVPKPRKSAPRMVFGMLVKGIEPPAYALRVRCSTPELHQLKADFSVKQKILYNFQPETQAYFSLFSALLNC